MKNMDDSTETRAAEEITASAERTASGESKEPSERAASGESKGPADSKPDNSGGKPKKKKKKHLVLKLTGILIIVVLIGVFAFKEYFRMRNLEGRTAYRLNDELALEMSPVDNDKLSAIENGERYSGEDTWAFYCYMIGSNLESGGRNELSELAGYEIADEVEELAEYHREDSKRRLTDIINTIESHNLDLPSMFYAPDKSAEEQGTGFLEEYVEAFMMPAFASRYIREMTECELPDNVQVVFQTGGAGAWSMTEVNPNRTQRFLYSSETNGLEEISSVKLQNMASSETLADFLSFCRRSYPADHEVVIFFDHGGASVGYGHDELFNDLMSLSDIRSAFEAVCRPDEKDPPFEAVVYDCCLMASMEVAGSMQGIARYMIASEEVSYSYYTEKEEHVKNWFEKFCEDTTVTGAGLGVLMTDSYAHYVMLHGEEQGAAVGSDRVVYDLEKAAKVQPLYEAFAARVLKDCVDEPSWLSALSRAANSSIFLASDAYKTYNTIDLGLFMENMSSYYPEETKAVLDAVDDAVLYRRGTNYMAGASGMSVYFPAHIDTLGGLNRFTTILEDVCTSPDVSALYYYKAAGCMNNEQEQYCRNAGYGEVKTLNFDALYDIKKLPVEQNGSNLSVVLTDKQAAVTADARYELVRYDEILGEISYFGEDRFVAYSEDDPAGLDSDFENKWIMIENQPLYLQVTSCTDEEIMYVSPVKYNGFEKQLLLSYNFDTEEVSVLGVRDYSNETGMLDRGIYSLKNGDVLVPQYYKSDIRGGSMHLADGKKISWNDKKAAVDKSLSDGTYAARIVIEDLRSDKYFTSAVSFETAKGEVTASGPLGPEVYIGRIW